MKKADVYEIIGKNSKEIEKDLATVNAWKKSGKELKISALNIMNAIAGTACAIIDDVASAPEIFHAGNGKIDKSVLCQSIAAVFSYGMHCHGCYAVNCMIGAHGNDVTLSWYRWYFIEKYFPGLYFSRVRYELFHTQKNIVRLHESGDFIDDADAARWYEIMKEFPHIRFYTYTKRSFQAVAEMRALANVNIVNSLPCGKINYGSPEYVATLAATIIAAGKECHICACGTAAEKAYNKAHKKTADNPAGDNAKYCGGVCKACAYCENVLFYEHK